MVNPLENKTPLHEDSDFKQVSSTNKCFICGKYTNWVEINYECYLCSVNCRNIIDNDFFHALEKQNKKVVNKEIKRNRKSIIRLELVNDLFTRDETEINEQEAFEVLWGYLAVKLGRTSGIFFKEAAIISKQELHDYHLIKYGKYKKGGSK